VLKAGVAAICMAHMCAEISALREEVSRLKSDLGFRDETQRRLKALLAEVRHQERLRCETITACDDEILRLRRLLEKNETGHGRG
jgi:hypothetical protein